MGCGHSLASVGKVAPTPNDVITKDHFDVERLIGQGGFARVNAVVKRKGHDKNCWYAMKTLQKGIILERNHLGMVMKERMLLAKLHCPHLVNMHYAFQDARYLYIVMDEQAKFYTASVILGLEYMHSLGVLHRDVKPENLLLDRFGHLKITDLGVSMEVVDGVCTSTSGTRPYMAPEIFMSGHKHNQAADFYSLGITTYQFLLGQRPYKPDTANMKAIVRMATFIPPEKYTDVKHIRKILIAAQERRAPSPEFRYSARLAKVSAEARDFVQSCLICNPKYRLGARGIQELMSHPWFAGLDWDALREQRLPAPFIPDLKQANCAISDAEAAAILANEEESLRKLPPISAEDQQKFAGFDYRTSATDNDSGRQERMVRPMAFVESQPMPGEGADTITVAQTAELLHTTSMQGSMRYASEQSVTGIQMMKSPSSASSVGPLLQQRVVSVDHVTQTPSLAMGTVSPFTDATQPPLDYTPMPRAGLSAPFTDNGSSLPGSINMTGPGFFRGDGSVSRLGDNTDATDKPRSLGPSRYGSEGSAQYPADVSAPNYHNDGGVAPHFSNIKHLPSVDIRAPAGDNGTESVTESRK